MAYKLHIPDCILEPHHPFHFPTPNNPFTDSHPRYRGFDYYGVTFDHLVPAGDTDPEVLDINIIELEAKDGLYANGLDYANETLSFKLDPLSDLRAKVLAVPEVLSKAQGDKG
ncbi:hypothetical protein MCOR34_006701 [Pyricularia oryzae]|uniref:Uncharacterized protein n=1 Tax=Pyricularia grisea TaxID=148305 RepID=A0ABQ8NX56_PYRGI|nr:hypothetical protein MCOR33_001496 [Pyricularia grisea]KAI6309686.1 hypothetical protein MCOR34_006701 [Pyricularia oryzae]